MAFRPTDFSYEQNSMFDHYATMTSRKQRMFDSSWAPAFRTEILYKIDEEPFRVLFDEEGSASRPNSPINRLVAAEILRALYNLSDSELLENIAFDSRYAYALHLDAINDDAFSGRTLRRFRKRCVDYYQTTGIDLIKVTMESLSESLAKIMEIDMTNRRMDSFMVDMSAKNMSRKELIYNAIRGFVTYLFFIGDVQSISYMHHYIEEGDRNRVLYYSEGDKNKRDTVFMNDTSRLIEIYGDRYKDEKAYQVFLRVVNEQTIVDADGSRRWRVKDDGGLNSSIMQSTNDPDATFRSKAGKDYKGYIANVEESVNSNGNSLITGYDFETNNTSDQEMLENHLKNQPAQESQVIIVTDGGFDSEEARKLAEEKNIKIITTDLLGQDVDPVFGAFKLNDDGTAVLRCPHGAIPFESIYNDKTGQITAKFKITDCSQCPYSQICHPTGKKSATVRVSEKKVQRSLLQAEMSTEEFKLFGRFRNGVETIPSFFRTVMNVDRMYAYNYIRNRFFFGFRVIAFNTMKLFMHHDCRRAKYA